ncbi:MAG: hypothetical protein ACI4TU_11705 [Candidatus Cryptobacteroides sp.]
MRNLFSESCSAEAEQLLDRGLSFMQASRFDEAVRCLLSAAGHPCASSYVKNKANAAIQLIAQITGFVNKDLMNP